MKEEEGNIFNIKDSTATHIHRIFPGVRNADTKNPFDLSINFRYLSLTIQKRLVLRIACFPFFVNHIERRIQNKLREVRSRFLLFHQVQAILIPPLSQQRLKEVDCHFQILQNEPGLPWYNKKKLELFYFPVFVQYHGK